MASIISLVFIIVIIKFVIKASKSSQAILFGYAENLSGCSAGEDPCRDPSLRKIHYFGYAERRPDLQRHCGRPCDPATLYFGGTGDVVEVVLADFSDDTYGEWGSVGALLICVDD